MIAEYNGFVFILFILSNDDWLTTFNLFPKNKQIISELFRGETISFHHNRFQFRKHLNNIHRLINFLWFQFRIRNI